ARAVPRRAGRRPQDMSHQAQSSPDDVLEQLQLSQSALRRELDDTRIELEQTRRQLQAARQRLAKAEANMGRLARIDEVTGLANRRGFDEALNEEIKRMLRSQAQLSMMLVEIDQWSSYVGREGKPRAAETLRTVADIIDGSFRRAGDLVGRHGSARFGVVLPATGDETASRFADRLLNAVHDQVIPFADSSVSDRVSISIGMVVLAPNRLRDGDELVAVAEEQLEAAHSNGGNQTVKRMML
ncbi:MAG: GGDEF domain-containing protein, partial [Pseudomonadota bacterium]